MLVFTLNSRLHDVTLIERYVGQSTISFSICDVAYVLKTYHNKPQCIDFAFLFRPKKSLYQSFNDLLLMF